jgi:hypothetical protein
LYRRDEPAAGRELRLERGRHRRAAAAATLIASNGACGRQPARAVADHQRHVLHAGRREVRAACSDSSAWRSMLHTCAASRASTAAW